MFGTFDCMFTVYESQKRARDADYSSFDRIKDVTQEEFPVCVEIFHITEVEFHVD